MARLREYGKETVVIESNVIQHSGYLRRFDITFFYDSSLLSASSLLPPVILPADFAVCGLAGDIGLVDDHNIKNDGECCGRFNFGTIFEFFDCMFLPMSIGRLLRL